MFRTYFFILGIYHYPWNVVNTDIMANNENKIDMLNYWIEEIVKFLRTKMEIDPLP